MPEPQTCSVIVPTYNRSHLLGYTLEALTRQDLPAEQFEVIVADDGSTDDTPAVVERYRGRLNLSYHAQERQGPRVAAARNLGVRHASGDICVLLDSGVLAQSGCLRAHLDSHARDDGPHAVIGYVWGFNLNNEGADVIMRITDPEDADAAIATLAEDGRWPDMRDEFYRRYDDDFAHLPAPWTVYWTCNVSVRTDQVRRVGLFDEQLRGWGGEDLDLAIRLHLDGARFVLNRAAASLHYPHEKRFDDQMASLIPNYLQIVAKYDTPIIRLLPSIPTINPFNLNDVAAFLDLPSCVEILASRR
jgi:glycosyltransferase involved in cell wall biosynthesis